MWAYFALRAGWLKINVGTNLGPQIFMYLSALEFVIKDRISIMVTISDPQPKRRAERSKVVHVIAKGDDEHTIESVRTSQQKADYMKNRCKIQ